LKKLTIILLCLFLCGCTKTEGAMDAGLALRSDLLSASGCTLDATVTADYGNKTYTFAMGCEFDAHGNLSFIVQSPQTIADISGTVGSQGGALTFDDIALSFPLLADEQLSPVSAPWIFMKTLRSGFITSAGMDDGKTRLIIDETYEDKTLTVHVWLDEGSKPVQAELYWDGRRILTLEVTNFVIL
jgi:hypothetical protein